EHADASDGRFDEHLTSGTDPGASAYLSEYRQGTGLFPRLQPRQFPNDDSPADESPRDEPVRDEPARDEPARDEPARDEPARDEPAPDEEARDEFPPQAAFGLPVMGQLPAPDALPAPGHPAMTGYQPAASPSAFPETEASWPFAPATERPAFRPPQYRHAEPYQAEPPEPYQARPPEPYSSQPPEPYSSQPPEPFLAQSEDAYAEQPADGYQEWPADDRDQPGDSYPGQSQDPYLAPRSSTEAPPLRGSSVPLSDILGGTRREEAPPFPESQPQFPSATPPFPATAVGEPLSAPPSLTARGAAEPLPGETSESLTADVLLHGKRAVPGVGWRRTVYRATGGLVHIDESAAARRRRDLINRVRTPVAGGHHRVAVMSLKGGVGKTTAAVGLGSTLASMRGDRVIAVDGNPDRGTLSDKVRLETPATIRDLLNEPP